jgi:hypothetical protein
MTTTGDTVILYRAENDAGLGPFQAGYRDTHNRFADREAAEDPDRYAETRALAESEGHRRFREVKHPLVRPHVIFGCETLADLRIWWPSLTGCEALTRAGFFLAAYRADARTAIVGPRELGVDRRAARLLWGRPLSDLHRMQWQDTSP